MPAEVIERYVRGLNPWPGCFTHLEGKVLKIWGSRVADPSLFEKEAAAPGCVIAVTKQDIFVSCGTGVLAIEELQMSGKKRMTSREFLAGKKLATGTQFTVEPSGDTYG